MYYDKIMKLSDTNYLKFTSSLIPTSKKPIVGVRLPVLRSLAKEVISKKEELVSFLEQDLSNSRVFEEIMLYILVVTSLKYPVEEVIKYVDKVLPYLDNWSTTDTLATSLKITKKEKEKMMTYILSKLDSDLVYVNRFVIVMFLAYYLEDNYIDVVFSKLEEVMNKVIITDYYLKMAIAWCLSICYINYSDIVIMFLEEKVNDTFIYHKTISKIVESYRISIEKKEIAKALRGKK